MDANHLVVSKMGTPTEDSDAVTIKLKKKNHALYLNTDIDVKNRIIKNLVRPKGSHEP